MNNLTDDELVEQGAIPPDDFHDHIERIREIADRDLEIPPDLVQRLENEAEGLLVDPSVLYASAAALCAGHLVLQGPPGTGKTSLANALVRAFHCSSWSVTAHENWSTYDVVGRNTLEWGEDGRERIVPKNGFFTESVIRCAGAVSRHFDHPEEPQAVWLVIDEFNRAHIERAFGEVFSAIGTDEMRPVLLSHQKEGNSALVTPRRFRIIATLNSIDRQFVNSLGQGLKRRFTFITVDIPEQKPSTEAWGSKEPSGSLASREFQVVISRAYERIAGRTNGVQDIEPRLEEIMTISHNNFVSLFELVAGVRYATQGSGIPYLPIGTAQLIDTIDLYVNRILTEGLQSPQYSSAMDWAVSVKLGPLFDSDTISPAELEQYAHNLGSPFDTLTRRELLKIAAVGMHYVG